MNYIRLALFIVLVGDSPAYCATVARDGLAIPTMVRTALPNIPFLELDAACIHLLPSYLFINRPSETRPPRKVREVASCKQISNTLLLDVVTFYLLVINCSSTMVVADSVRYLYQVKLVIQKVLQLVTLMRMG